MQGCCVGSDLHVAEFVSYLSRGVVSTDDFLESSRRAQVRLKGAPFEVGFGCSAQPLQKEASEFRPQIFETTSSLSCASPKRRTPAK